MCIVRMHRERMFAFEYALVEIHIENNRMMRDRARESLLRICIQQWSGFVNGGVCKHFAHTLIHVRLDSSYIIYVLPCNQFYVM